MSANALDDHLHARDVRRLLESYGYSVASVTSESGRIVTVVAPPEGRRDAVVAGRLRLDPDLQLLGCAGKLVALTATETALLHPLLLRAETIVTQSELVAAAWPGNETGACKNRLYTHMFALRRKLAKARAGATIQTFRRGYRLAVGTTGGLAR
jgi:DNA-binding response OmpR family regulator